MITDFFFSFFMFKKNQVFCVKTFGRYLNVFDIKLAFNYNSNFVEENVSHGYRYVSYLKGY